MRRDVMGSASSMSNWSDIKDTSEYTRQIFYLSGNNQIDSESYLCHIKRHKKQLSVTIFDVNFIVEKYSEMCANHDTEISNIYFVDKETIVRKSIQYHGPALGYVTIERLDR